MAYATTRRPHLQRWIYGLRQVDGRLGDPTEAYPRARLVHHQVSLRPRQGFLFLFLHPILFLHPVLFLDPILFLYPVLLLDPILFLHPIFFASYFVFASFFVFASYFVFVSCFVFVLFLYPIFFASYFFLQPTFFPVLFILRSSLNFWRQARWRTNLAWQRRHPPPPSSCTHSVSCLALHFENGL